MNTATAGEVPLSTVGPLTGPNNREDWWAVAIGIGLTAVAVALFAAGGSIRWIAIAPAEVEPPGAGRYTAQGPRAAVPGAVRAVGRGVRRGHGVPGLPHGCVPAHLRARVRRLAAALLPGSVGSGRPLQPRTAAGRAGAGTADCQHGGRAQVGGRRVARGALHQDRHRAARHGAAADADCVGRAGRAAAGRHRLARDLRGHLFHGHAPRAGQAAGGSARHRRCRVRRVGLHRHHRRRRGAQGTRLGLDLAGGVLGDRADLRAAAGRAQPRPRDRRRGCLDRHLGACRCDRPGRGTGLWRVRGQGRQASPATAMRRSTPSR